METDYLLLSTMISTLGFLIWYGFFAAYRLQPSFQVQFDINDSYANRMLRKKWVGALIYGLLPYLLIFFWEVLGNVSWRDLQISFEWNNRVAYWFLISTPIILIINFFGAGNPSRLTLYPEIRVTIWSPWLIFISALSWVAYLVALEFLFRGLLLQSILMNVGNQWVAIFICTGMYAMTHYFKNSRISVFCIPYGFIICYITLDCGSLLPAIYAHVLNALLMEWVSIYKHPELKVQF